MTQTPRTLGAIAEALGAQLKGDADVVITGIGTLQSSDAGQISFLANATYARYLPETKASAVVLNEAFADQCPTNVLVMDNPYLGYARLSHWFDPAGRPATGIHPSATVDPSASVAASASVGAGAVIEADAVVGEGVVVGAGSVVGARCHIGEDSRLWPNVTLYHDVYIGKRCILHSGAILGADGFGFANERGVWHKIAQIGGVRVGDDVEIGANTTIDRGALEDTVIGDGVKLDNQIQIAHNVQIGAHTAIAACVGIAGSTTIGEYCIFGGGSGVGGHLEITDRVHLTGMTMVTRSLNEPGVYSSGTGVESNKQWRKSVVRFRQLDDMARRLKALEKKLSD